MTEAKPELVECRACGHQISVKAKFCPNCGDRITLKEKVLKPYQKTTNFLKRWNHHYQIEKQKRAEERTRLAEIRRQIITKSPIQPFLKVLFKALIPLMFTAVFLALLVTIIHTYF